METLLKRISDRVHVNQAIVARILTSILILAMIIAPQVSFSTIDSSSILKVKVVERETKSPIHDATVIVAEKSGKILVWKITDKHGTQQLRVPSGDYYIMIKASCFYTKMDNLRIRGDMEKIFELVDR